MKKRSLLIFVALALVPLILLAQISSPGSYSSVIMTFLRSTTAAAARSAIGAANSGSGGTLTNAVIYGSTSGSATFSSTGRLSIGTGTALAPLHVVSSDNTSAALSASVNPTIFVSTGSGYYAAEFSGNSSYTGFLVSSTTSTAVPFVQFNNSANAKLWTLMQGNAAASSRFSIVEGTAVGTERMTFLVGGGVGIGTTVPEKALDINSATGAALQLTYNDNNGSAANKVTFDVSSGGNLTIAPSGGFVGIGGATPTHALTIPTSSTGIAIYNTADQTTNLERGLIQWSGNTLNIQAASAGSGVLRKVRLLSGGSSVEAVGNATPFVSLTPATSSTTGNFIQASTSSGGLTGSSGTQVMLAVVPTYNQTGTAGGTDLLINRTQTAIGSGAQLLFDAQVSASSKFSVNNAGAVVFAGYLASGVQSLSGAGAVNVTTGITELTSTGVAQAITLADGVAGQEKTIIHGVDGGSMVLTPETKTGFSTVTFTTAGESVTLVFLATRGWCVKSSYLATIAP